MTEQTLTDSKERFQSYKENSLWRLTLRRVLRQRSAIVGMVILGILLLIAIFAPYLAPYDPNQSLIGVEDVTRRQAPCTEYLKKWVC